MVQSMPYLPSGIVVCHPKWLLGGRPRREEDSVGEIQASIEVSVGTSQSFQKPTPCSLSGYWNVRWWGIFKIAVCQLLTPYRKLNQKWTFISWMSWTVSPTSSPSPPHVFLEGGGQFKMIQLDKTFTQVGPLHGITEYWHFSGKMSTIYR